MSSTIDKEQYDDFIERFTFRLPTEPEIVAIKDVFRQFREVGELVIWYARDRKMAFRSIDALEHALFLAVGSITRGNPPKEGESD